MPVRLKNIFFITSIEFSKFLSFIYSKEMFDFVDYIIIVCKEIFAATMMQSQGQNLFISEFQILLPQFKHKQNMD